MYFIYQKFYLHERVPVTIVTENLFCTLISNASSDIFINYLTMIHEVQGMDRIFQSLFQGVIKLSPWYIRLGKNGGFLAYHA